MGVVLPLQIKIPAKLNCYEMTANHLNSLMLYRSPSAEPSAEAISRLMDSAAITGSSA